MPDGDEFLCVDDAYAEPAEPGAPCEFINECRAGLFCADPALAPELCAGVGDDFGCCLRFCDYPSADGCEGALVCTAYFDQPPAQYADVGYCGEAMP